MTAERLWLIREETEQKSEVFEVADDLYACYIDKTQIGAGNFQITIVNLILHLILHYYYSKNITKPLVGRFFLAIDQFVFCKGQDVLK